MRTIKALSLCLLYLFTHTFILAQSLHVGPGQPYSNLSAAADDAAPGDSIIIHQGTYGGGIFINELQGAPGEKIVITTAPGAEVIFEGGTNAWQFTDAAYLHIQGLIFQHQTGNGLNFDDGGSYETPAHHVIFENCVFRDMDASGNNDLLKLSGLDDFEIRNCTFINGAQGGSGIDLVGCHNGIITGNHFENLGSNSIQAKGGTSEILIEKNLFKNGGARAVNLGGSTGLQFFRPIDAPYESAHLKVYSNIFIGSQAPVAYVGTVNTEVVNNTIYLPEKWVLRILQETVDPSRFAPCGQNSFINNIIYMDDRVSVECNIGPNTAPETFTFSNNLWYQSDNTNWDGPELPTEDTDQIINEDPEFVSAASEDFDLLTVSPAIGQGLDVDQPSLDYSGEPFASFRSIGAHEGGVATGTVEDSKDFNLKIYPNPSKGNFRIEGVDVEGKIRITGFDGKLLFEKHITTSGEIETHTTPGMYLVQLVTENGINSAKLVITE